MTTVGSIREYTKSQIHKYKDANAQIQRCKYTNTGNVRLDKIPPTSTHTKIQSCQKYNHCQYQTITRKKTL